MRQPKKRLTARGVTTINEPGKYHDGNGLILKVDPSGAKRWIQRVTVKGRRREFGLGSAELVTLSEAREIALDNRRIAHSGLDPLEEKKKRQSVPTFAEAARAVHELHLPTWRNPKHAAQFISTLETYAFPRMGETPVSDVSTADLLAVLQPIWVTKAETARRVRQRIGRIMKWAIAQGWRQDNPADAISQVLPKQVTKAVNRKALPYAEVSNCMSAIRASGAWTATKLALEFTILTASRSGEVRGAVWQEIDLESATWTLPANRMKMTREHRVPLAPRCCDILVEAKNIRLPHTDLVFPSMTGKQLSDATMLKLVRDLGFEVDIHGFRTSFRTWVQEQTEVAREVAEAALAHKLENKVEAAYARSDFFDRRRSLMEAWADYVIAR